MKKELNSKTNSKKEKIGLDALEMISGGTGPNDFDMEYWQRYYQECQETAQQSATVDPNNPHSKKSRGGLFR